MSLNTARLLNDLARQLKAKKATGWDIYLDQSETIRVEAKDGGVESMTKAISTGLGIRAIHKKAAGFAYTTDFSKPALKWAVDSAVASAKAATPDDFMKIAPNTPIPANDLELTDPALTALTDKNKIDLALQLESMTRRSDRRITRVRNAHYQEVKKTISIWNSEGMKREAGTVQSVMSVMAVAESGGDCQSGYDFVESRFLEDLNPGRVARKAALNAVEQLGAKPIQSRNGPVVLDALAACELLGALSPSFCADAVQKKRSWLDNKVGKKVFSPLITIYDNGLLPKGTGTFPFDDEGVPRQKTTLVREGILENFLYDTYTAAKAGTKSTGNCTRSSGFQSGPSVGISNCYIRRGSFSLKDLLSELRSGLFITDLSGVHTANPVSGEFSLGCSGFIVENGRRTGPFNGMVISGSLFDLFLKVEALGNDMRFVNGVGSPSLLVSKATVAGN